MLYDITAYIITWILNYTRLRRALNCLTCPVRLHLVHACKCKFPACQGAIGNPGIILPLSQWIKQIPMNYFPVENFRDERMIIDQFHHVDHRHIHGKCKSITGVNLKIKEQIAVSALSLIGDLFKFLREQRYHFLPQHDQMLQFVTVNCFF